MIGVDAAAIIASVTNTIVIGDRIFEKLIGNPMSTTVLTITPNQSIAVEPYMARPFPAPGIGFMNLRKKSIRQRLLTQNSVMAL